MASLQAGSGMTMGSTPVGLAALVALCDEKNIVRGEDGEEPRGVVPPGAAMPHPRPAGGVSPPRRRPLGGKHSAHWAGPCRPWPAVASGPPRRGVARDVVHSWPASRVGRGGLVRRASSGLGQAAHPASIRNHQMVPPVALARCAHGAL